MFITIVIVIAQAQVPQGIPYQASARSITGAALTNQSVKIRFSIIDSVANGTVLYKETHTATTNSFGLFNLNIGIGTAFTGAFSNINWGASSKFLKVELDASGIGNSYIDMGTQQMMSVPYALFAGKVQTSQTTIVKDSAFYSGHGNLNITSSSYFIIPSGVSSVKVIAIGGGGSSSHGYNVTPYPSSGGSGGYVQTIISVKSGDSLYLVVGSSNVSSKVFVNSEQVIEANAGNTGWVGANGGSYNVYKTGISCICTNGVSGTTTSGSPQQINSTSNTKGYNVGPFQDVGAGGHAGWYNDIDGINGIIVIEY